MFSCDNRPKGTANTSNLHSCKHDYYFFVSLGRLNTYKGQSLNERYRWRTGLLSVISDYVPFQLAVAPLSHKPVQKKSLAACAVLSFTFGQSFERSRVKSQYVKVRFTVTVLSGCCFLSLTEFLMGEARHDQPSEPH